MLQRGQRHVGLGRIPGQDAVLLRPRHRERRDLHRLLVGRNGAGQVALLGVDAAHHVVGIGVLRLVVEQVADGRHRGIGLAVGLQHPRQAQLGPGHGLVGQHRGIHGAGQRQPLQPQRQFGAQAGGMGPVRPALLVAHLAQCQRLGMVVALDRVVHLAQRVLALEGGDQPVFQLAWRVGLDDEAVQRRFGHLRHHLVRGLGGQHHHHGAQRQLAVAAQLVDQRLALDVVVELVLHQQHVDPQVGHVLACVVRGGAMQHLAHAQATQLRRQHAARRGMAIDDERTAPGAETRLNLQLVGEIGQTVLVEPLRGGWLRPSDRRAPTRLSTARRAA